MYNLYISLFGIYQGLLKFVLQVTHGLHRVTREVFVVAIRIKFTKHKLDGLPLPEGKDRDTYLDTDPPGAKKSEAVQGLQLVVSSAGTKSFVLCRKLNGKTKRITIGRFPAIPVEDARKRAVQLGVDLANGIDPMEAKRAERIKGKTLLNVYEDYIDTRDLSDNTKSNYKTIMNSHLSAWKDKPLKSINRDMISDKHKEISQFSATAANKSMRLLRALFNFAYHYVDEDGKSLFPDNPVKSLTARNSWNKEGKRIGLVKEYEIAAWFAAVLQIKDDNINSPGSIVSDYLQMACLTGMRRREVTGMRWDEVDLKEKSFLRDHTKNGEALYLPLSDYLYRLLVEREESRVNEYVFPGRFGKGGFCEPKIQIEIVREISGVYFTSHDLRRTFITNAEQLAIPHYTLKRIVNHKADDDVTRRYVQLTIEHLRDPMQKIEDHFLKMAGIKESAEIVTFDGRSSVERQKNQ